MEARTAAGLFDILDAAQKEASPSDQMQIFNFILPYTANLLGEQAIAWLRAWEHPNTPNATTHAFLTWLRSVLVSQERRFYLTLMEKIAEAMITFKEVVQARIRQQICSDETTAFLVGSLLHCRAVALCMAHGLSRESAATDTGRVNMMLADVTSGDSILKDTELFLRLHTDQAVASFSAQTGHGFVEKSSTIHRKVTVEPCKKSAVVWLSPPTLRKGAETLAVPEDMVFYRSEWTGPPAAAHIAERWQNLVAAFVFLAGGALRVMKRSLEHIRPNEALLEYVILDHLAHQQNDVTSLELLFVQTQNYLTTIYTPEVAVCQKQLAVTSRDSRRALKCFRDSIATDYVFFKGNVPAVVHVLSDI